MTKEREFPSLDELKVFLSAKANMLEALNQNILSKREHLKKSYDTRGLLVTENEQKDTQDQPKCMFCRGSHYLQNCKDLLHIPVS